METNFEAQYRELIDALTKLRDGWAKTDFPDEETATTMQRDLARVLTPFEMAHEEG
jgi:hypothetical protein